MKARFANPKHVAFTLIELLVVLAIIAILAALVLPTKSGPKVARRVQCMSNQKQVAIALILFSYDYSNAFPAMISITNGGAMESMVTGDVVKCYVALTNITRNPNVFLCPADRSRQSAQSGRPMTRTNVSYFISLDASPTNSPAYSILTGDRHLSLNTKPVSPGLFPLSTNELSGWTTELHADGNQQAGGNLAFADGHCEWVKAVSLSKVIARQNLPTNRLAVP